MLDSAPDLGALAEAGEAAAEEASSEATEEAEEGAASAMDGAMASVGSALGSVGGAMGGLDLSSLSKLTDLTKNFEGLGLEAGMVQKFVPVVLEQLGSGSASAGLLKKGLGLL